MVYVFGIVGFLGGFAAGVFVIGQILRGRSRTELIQNKSLRWTYGLMVWVLAGLGAWAGVWLYAQT
ncbi:MAG: hypothetical protein J0L77_02520 [Alphaproteobacteria bacterium]|nr:hypothetical protein [Alphaproteobacteria bacterium]